MRKGGGISFVLVIVVVAVVLFLTARAWNSVAPTAVEVLNTGDAPPIPVHGQTEAAEALRSGQLPGLNQMRQDTGAHAKELQDTLAQIE